MLSQAVRRQCAPHSLRRILGQKALRWAGTAMVAAEGEGGRPTAQRATGRARPLWPLGRQPAALHGTNSADLRTQRTRVMTAVGECLTGATHFRVEGAVCLDEHSRLEYGILLVRHAVVTHWRSC